MRTILVFAVFLCIQSCSGRHFMNRFFRYKPRMPFIESELLDEACEDDPKYADGCGELAAVENYCKDQEDFMKKHCAKTCQFCAEGTVKPPAPAACEDDPKYADGCGELAAVKNYCKDQEDFMKKHCAKTCQFCPEGTVKPPAPAVCEDDPNYADRCPEKAAIEGYCKDQEEFMRKNCAKSCGFCSEEP